MEENKEIDYIFETQDPLNYDIKLKEETWENHIIGDHSDRENFRGNENFFKSLVEDPDYIFEQKTLSGKTRWNYTTYANIKDEGNPKIYHIIADHHENGYRDIVTIFPKNSTKLSDENEKTKEGKVYDRRRDGKN
ncbi:hypothetical protein WL507_00655 [Staphylococcus saprophyticus]|uniref:hypothetical protein n=1 Tax=Staphylococcus saprophyticus TaxID=29385 RepID=UPI0030C4095B